MIACRVCSTYGGLLCGKRRAFTGTSETERAGALPRKRVADLVGNGNDRVVEAGLNEHEAKWNVLPLTLLELFVFSGFGTGAFVLGLRHNLLRRFLLPGDSALARALAGTSVGVGSLAADWERAPVAKTAVGLNFNQSLDVK